MAKPRKQAPIADAGSSPTGRWLAYGRLIVPLLAPLLIALCDTRRDLWLAAVAWSVFCIPGSALAFALFRPPHPLGRIAGSTAVASGTSLLVFGVGSWAGCVWHWRLGTVMGLYAAIGTAIVVLAVLLERRRRTEAPPSSAAEIELPASSSRKSSLAVIAGIGLIAAGTVMTSRAAPGDRPLGDGFVAKQLRSGPQVDVAGMCVSGAGAALVAVVGLSSMLSARKRRPEKSPKPDRPPAPRRTAPHNASPFATVLPAVLWLAVAALTFYLMKWSYLLPPSELAKPGWNSDDVTYVSQAVDYRYGLPLAAYEPSLGSERPMKSVNASLLFAPLMGAISRTTGVGCAALHHSVYPPLAVLLGISAAAVVLATIFWNRPEAVPLGLIAILLVWVKSWEYDRNLIVFMLYRAMQPKSLHLSLGLPLQLATLLLIVQRRTWSSAATACGAGLVAYLMHPFAIIVGVVWTAAGGGWALLTDRKLAVKLAAVLALYGLLGVQVKLASRSESSTVARSSASAAKAKPTGPLKDLAYDGDEQVMRLGRDVQFGYDLAFQLAAFSVPVFFWAGRRRELAYLGVIGIVAVICCNGSVFPGRFLNVALPSTIFWRVKWLMPMYVGIAALTGVAYLNVALLLRGPAASPWRALASAVIVLGGIFAICWMAPSKTLQQGEPPEQLSRFSADVHQLVDGLGGVEAAPFVWGPRTVTRELPQLMPHVRLAMSRMKIQRTADHPQFRNLLLRTQARFRQGAVDRGELELLLRLYPIDHIVLDRAGGRSRQPAPVLERLGWSATAFAGRYEIWTQAAPH